MAPTSCSLKRADPVLQNHPYPPSGRHIPGPEDSSHWASCPAALRSPEKLARRPPHSMKASSPRWAEDTSFSELCSPPSIFFLFSFLDRNLGNVFFFLNKEVILKGQPHEDKALALLRPLGKPHLCLP